MVDAIFTPEQLAEIRAYHQPGYIWSIAGDVFWLVTELLILRFVLRRLYGAAERTAVGLDRRLGFFRRLPVLRAFFKAIELLWGEPGWGTAVLFVLFSFLLRSLVDLPIGVYFGYFHEHRYGMSSATPGRVMWDYFKNATLMATAITALSFGLFGLARRLKRWWLAVGVVAIVVMTFSAALDPYRARVFYTQKPMVEGPLREKITALMAQANIDFKDVLVEETLETTVRVQAYFAGRGPTRTIVVNDALLKNLTDDEVLAAIAHEAGHVNESRWLGAIGSSLTLLAFLWLVDRLLRAVARRGWWGISESQPADVRALPLVFVVFQLATMAAQPISAAVSRERERKADLYGLRLTANPDAFEKMLVKAARVNKMDPDAPRWATWRWSHPPIRERIEAVERGDWKNTNGG